MREPTGFMRLVQTDGRATSEFLRFLIDLVRQLNAAPSYTVLTLPSASPVGQSIFVSDETGGAVMAFSDGTNWRRCTDRAIVS